MTLPFVRSVYGLGLAANLSIPALDALPPAPRVDVQVFLGPIPPWLKQITHAPAQEQRISPYYDESGEPLFRLWKLAKGAYFRFLYSDATEFVVDTGGTRIWANWPGSTTLEDTLTYLLGPVLGFVLRLRGAICLHASAIALGSRAIALLGPAGSGKSTTAAAFVGLGYSVLSGDIAVILNQNDSFLVQPGYPRLNLWPEAVEALYGSADALPRITPTWDKQYLDLTENGYRFQPQPLPLAAMYVLGERTAGPAAPFVEAVRASAGLVKLVSNTYATYLLDKSMRAQEFDLVSRLSERVPLRQVTPHAGVTYLPKLCKVILDDFQSLIPHTSLRPTVNGADHV